MKLTKFLITATLIASAPAAAAPHAETAVLAGGCFWGMEAVFEHVKGVKDVVSGYAGGNARDAHYEAAESGHAEAVRITYDPARVTYAQLLQVFFTVAHDPTQVNRQGPDVGPSYRSAVFYENESQKRIAQAYIAQLDAAHVFARPIVTQVSPLKGFYRAEDYHQDYALNNPGNPYIQVCDRPKIELLKRQFPELFVEYKGRN